MHVSQQSTCGLRRSQDQPAAAARCWSCRRARRRTWPSSCAVAGGRRHGARPSPSSSPFWRSSFPAAAADPPAAAPQPEQVQQSACHDSSCVPPLPLRLCPPAIRFSCCAGRSIWAQDLRADAGHISSAVPGCAGSVDLAQPVASPKRSFDLTRMPMSAGVPALALHSSSARARSCSTTAAAAILPAKRLS